MPEIIEVTDSPNLALLYAKAVTSSVGGGDALPTDTLVRRDVAVDRDHLAAYNRVCGFGLTDRLPTTYPHLLAFPLSVSLMARRDFPLPLPGLVHVRNRIVQRRPIDADERLTVHVRTADLRPHPSGRQVDVAAEVVVGGEQVWSETSTYLKRGKGSDESEREQDPVGEVELRATGRWMVPRDTGRRYAAVSGDVNPIHLNPLTARLFGFPRPIAHGMWTKARALAALADRLPDALTVDVAFRKPLLLPATVTFADRSLDGGWAFAVRSRGGSPHLHGRVTTSQES